MLHRCGRVSGWAFLLLAPTLLSPVGAAGGSANASSGSLTHASLQRYRSHPEVRAHLRHYLGPGRRSLERSLSRGTPYLAMIQQHLVRHGLPAELAWLPLIESGFSVSAKSSAGAVGLWQFMPETARDYGLRVDHQVDERQDAAKATAAAVRHLRDLIDRFGSVFVAAAAYDAGAARVGRGLGLLEISRARDEDFFRLSRAALLSKETRDYVPRLIAAALIAGNPRQYGLRVDAPAERSSGPAGGSRLRHRPGPEAAGPHPRVRVEPEDTIASLAARHGVTVRELCRVNMLPAGSALRPGRVLFLPRPPTKPPRAGHAN